MKQEPVEDNPLLRPVPPHLVPMLREAWDIKEKEDRETLKSLIEYGKEIYKNET